MEKHGHELSEKKTQNNRNITKLKREKIDTHQLPSLCRWLDFFLLFIFFHLRIPCNSVYMRQKSSRK